MAMQKVTGAGNCLPQKHVHQGNKRKESYRPKHVQNVYSICPFSLVLSVIYLNEVWASHLLRLSKPCRLTRGLPVTPDFRHHQEPGHRNPACTGWQHMGNCQWACLRVWGAFKSFQLGSCLSRLFPRNRFNLTIVSSNDFCLISTVISANSP